MTDTHRCDNCGKEHASRVAAGYSHPLPDVDPTYAEWDEIWLCRECETGEPDEPDWPDWDDYWERVCPVHHVELPCSECDAELLEERRQEGFLNIHEL